MSAVRNFVPPRVLARYGALGLPLSFVALPLMVHWPAHAAANWGLTLATLGALLLAVRALDAVLDPWLGRLADRWLARGQAVRALVAASVCLMLGVVGLFVLAPPVQASWLQRTAAAALALILAYVGYSVALIVHQAWGARWGGDAVLRARIVGAREGFALAGVIAATALPALLPWTGIVALLAVALALAVALLAGLTPLASLGAGLGDAGRAGKPSAWDFSPWRRRDFRGLLLVYMINGFAAALPASLVLFFIRDHLRAHDWEPVFLLAYFGAAALSLPVWTRVVARIGLVRSWRAGMVLAVLAFAGAAALEDGDRMAYLAICLASGAALGADLIAPPALLTGLLQREGLRGHSEGVWFGWWTFAGKANLALAAGLALPLVQALGYVPGAAGGAGGLPLAVVYGALPCLVKLFACYALGRRASDWESPEGTRT